MLAADDTVLLGVTVADTVPLSLPVRDGDELCVAAAVRDTLAAAVTLPDSECDIVGVGEPLAVVDCVADELVVDDGELPTLTEAVDEAVADAVLEAVAAAVRVTDTDAVTLMLPEAVLLAVAVLLDDCVPEDELLVVALRDVVAVPL